MSYKFEVIEVDFNTNNEILSHIDSRFRDYPLVYLITNKKNALYVGETGDVLTRIKSHLKNEKRSNLTTFTLIMSNAFHKSATYNIETNLINMFLAEGKYKLQNTSQVNKKMTHNYYKKRNYDQIMFKEIWNELRRLDYATSDVDTLINSDVYKISPFKMLHLEQQVLKEKIITFCETNINNNKQSVFLVQGGAGTGKSVVLSSLFKSINELSKDTSSTLYNSSSSLLVNHTEMLKSYAKLISSLKGMKKKTVLKPTSYINNSKKDGYGSDVVLIDEAHLLLTESDNFNNFSENNQLEEIIKYSKIVILIFDEKQFLKMKSYWKFTDLEKLIKGYKKGNFVLKQQIRMNASLHTQDWIDTFINGKILSLNRDPNYEIKYFDNFKEMHESIKLYNEMCGLCRVVSTFDYIHKKDGKDYYVEEDNYKLPWNRSYNNAWAEVDETIDEVGSIYTIQGFDLNYVGLVIGESIDYDFETEQLIIYPKNYCDGTAFKKSNKNNIEDLEQVKRQIILNSLNVLIKRGMQGLFIYAVNDNLKKKLSESIK